MLCQHLRVIIPDADTKLPCPTLISQLLLCPGRSCAGLNSSFIMDVILSAPYYSIFGESTPNRDAIGAIYRPARNVSWPEIEAYLDLFTPLLDIGGPTVIRVVS